MQASKAALSSVCCKVHANVFFSCGDKTLAGSIVGELFDMSLNAYQQPKKINNILQPIRF